MISAFPWHDTLWHKIHTAYQQDRLPHAILFCGTLGMGKAALAQRLAALLLCETPLADGNPCGQCKACHLHQTHNHPDFLDISPAEAGKQILIDQIRHLIQFCALTSHHGRYQVALIHPAEAMNHNAANSLLKILEEPPAKTVLLLVSHQPSALMATIRSRCQRVDFTKIDTKITQQWLSHQLPNNNDIPLLLNLSAYAPLTALALAQGDALAQRNQLLDSLAKLPAGKDDPVKLAEAWGQMDARQVLSWMLSWTMDLIRLQVAGQQSDIINIDKRNILQGLTNNLPITTLFDLLDTQKEIYQLVKSSSNVKPQGLFESLAIAWSKARQ
ncbi:DNA polymerase III subunit delta' [Beggiatoa leptomitoformis]|uniref:DNA polymerase III subunit delta' n=1 Tax=Beggiatoa leptomitoformis TaxID=288004 RepID=A0A2N9YB31_9GAMM|nr:DNA polymerase III subunit delta' [Beggiatoa leptomitoformis]ALG66969.1 DNA polymerase III subunit delta' [Beggiatoa leptomitoformis]AUI67660.1 DNA polymerase III subunit delta' [Beggiatoa leptomitoformis]